MTGTTSVKSKSRIMSAELTVTCVPVPKVSQAVVTNQLVQVVSRMTSRAVASLPPASRVQITAEASVQGTLAEIIKPT